MLATYPDAAGWRDNDTSKAAALKIEAKKLDKEILFHIRKYCFGCSPEDLVRDFGYDLLSVRPAFSRLKVKRFIEDSGRRSKTASGNSCKIWISI